MMILSMLNWWTIIVVIILEMIQSSFGQSTDENQGVELMKVLNEEFISARFNAAQAEWDFAINITSETADKKTKAQKDYAMFKEAKGDDLRHYDYNSFKDESLKRQMNKLAKMGDSLLEDHSFMYLKSAITRMEDIYSKTKIPGYQDENKMMALEPEITEIMKNSRDPDEMKYYWVEWHNNVGTVNKEPFFLYADLRNEAAVLNKLSSGADTWLDEYEDPTIEQQVEDILDQIMPLYKQLHGYVRHKLNEIYGDDIVNVTQPIPMHLLGNMWGQQWDNIADLVIPYPDKPSLDVTNEMLRQHYTPLKMFQMGDEFFTSMNMTKLPEQFWQNSIIEKPNDGRELICHASAWDFSVPNDVRIKQCTRVNMENFIIIHHELGHIQYYLQYQDQPIAFRNGANPGFQEAVGDVLALSVATPKHLEKIGLLENFEYDEENQINQFVRMGMAKFAFLPFAYTMDKFRWATFRGEIEAENANCDFWNYRIDYGGIEPPVVRTNSDFDITAKYHVAADVEYLRYFVSFVTQFQFYKAACILAGEYEEGNPDKSLNNCDIHGSAEAGNVMKEMLSMGSSKPWPDAMEVMTGQRKMDAGPLLEYFKPLEDWLLKTNLELGVNVGWNPTDKLNCEKGPPLLFPTFPDFPKFTKYSN